LKNTRALILLFLANSVSGFAQGITMIAIPWYFTDILKIPGTFGVIYFFVTIASMIWSLYGGILVDKHNRKTLFIWQNVIGSVLIGAIALYGFSTGIVPAALAAVAFMLTIFVYNIHYPNLYAFAQEISDPKDYGKITSYIEIQGQATTMIAGACAAFLLSGTGDGTFTLLGQTFEYPFHIEAWPLHKILTVDACTYVLSALIILFITYVPVAKRTAETGGIKERLLVGLNFLKDKPMVMTFGLASYSVFATILVGVHLLVPNYVSNHLEEGASVFASSELLFALGALTAGILIRRIFSKTTLVNSVIIMTLITTVVYLFLFFSKSVMVLFIGFLFVGLCNAGCRIQRVTYLFSKIPNQIIGRTNSVFRTLNVTMRLIFISLFSLPFFVDDIRYSFLVMAVFLFVAAVVMIFYYRRLT